MRIFVLGAGNWGTTLSILFAENNDVFLWTIDHKEADDINLARENTRFLPGIKLPENLIVEEKYSTQLTENDLIVLAVPSRKMKEVAMELKSLDLPSYLVVNVSKGVEANTLKTVYETIKEILPNVHFANLSGPTIAREIAEGLPAKAILASQDLGLLFMLQTALENSLLKFEFSQDVKGIELASSLKGLIAIAVGLAEGLGYKTNVMGLIITYGLQEFAKVMHFLGVKTDTIYNISGIGDLITTCLSENSRNRNFGKLMGQGYTRDAALKLVGMEVEGVSMAKTVQKLAAFNISIPLICTIANIIFKDDIDVRKELIGTLNNISAF